MLPLLAAELVFQDAKFAALHDVPYDVHRAGLIAATTIIVPYQEAAFVLPLIAIAIGTAVAFTIDRSLNQERLFT